MPTFNWIPYFLAFVLLSLGGFVLVIASGFWHVLALLVLAALLLWFWQQARPSRK